MVECVKFLCFSRFQRWDAVRSLTYCTGAIHRKPRPTAWRTTTLSAVGMSRRSRANCKCITVTAYCNLDYMQFFEIRVHSFLPFFRFPLPSSFPFSFDSFSFSSISIPIKFTQLQPRSNVVHFTVNLTSVDNQNLASFTAPGLRQTQATQRLVRSRFYLLQGWLWSQRSLFLRVDI